MQVKHRPQFSGAGMPDMEGKSLAVFKAALLTGVGFTSKHKSVWI